ncbi:MAG: hypothetical protein P8X48_10670 [Acidiferrobacteraceae bacterium]|jgi:hypothetical protein
MKNSLWIIILIIVAFVSFLIGYSRPHDVKKAYTATSSSAAAQEQPLARGNGKMSAQSGLPLSVWRQASADKIPTV